MLQNEKAAYLFSGLLRCGECGGSIALVGGRANTSRSEYGCSLHAQRGDSVCKNSLRIQRHELEERLIAGLQERVLREEFIDYVICGLRDELRKQHEALNAELSELREEKRSIELRTLAVERVTQLRGLLTNPGTIHEARALLADQVGKFTLERVQSEGSVTFKANGKIDFFGEKALTQLSGAGGQNRTGYARLFRASLYR